ncbi:MAG TPA: hypothetical protein GX710_06865 [Clostridiales bacterium]|nr:hypothetical protein [Clostridiales bacterium]
MNCQSKIINLLTVCRKAGKLVLGFDVVKEAVLGDKAESVLVARDISPKTLKEAEFYCSKKNIKIIKLNCDMDTFVSIFKRKIAIMAVIDKGFTKRIIELSNEDTENP